MPPRPSPSICSRCSHRLQWARHSSSAKQGPVPPESPSFIHVPEPVQAPNYDPIRPIKGVLPVSRNIFGKHREYRATAPYKAQVTPEPKARAEAHGPEADRIKYDRQMSFVRRQTLREGISEIWARREKRSDVLSKSSGLKQLRNRRAATAPPPLDETLTTPTLHPSARLLIATGNAPGPKPRSASKYPQMQEKKSLARRSALHNLYVNAQHFIVSETQLNDEIDRVFGSDDAPVRWDQTNGVWGLKQKPMTAAEMLSIERRGDGKVVDEGGQGRMRRVVEVLTGGRMSEIGGPDGKSL